MLKGPFIAVFTLILGVYLCSCKKQEQVNFSYTTYAISSQIKLQNSYWTDPNTGYVCGGLRNEIGKIFKTIDGGNSWNELYSTPSRSLYDICFINDSMGYCCGENFFFLQTVDRGKTWKEYDFKGQPPSYDMVTLRNIYINKNVMVVSGGDNFNKGLIINFVNNNFTPYYSHRDSEMRSALSFNNNITFLVFGYGYAFESNDTVKTFKPTKLTGDFYTSACAIDNTSGYCCGYDGGIYKTTDAGNSWQKQSDVNRLFKTRVHLNAIYFVNANNGWCVGDNGVMMHTSDGNTWEKVELKTTDNLFSVRKKGTNALVVSSSGGNLYEFN